MIIPIGYTSPVAWPDSFAAGTASCQKAEDLDALRLAILERYSVLGLSSLNNLYTPDYIPYPQKALDSDVLLAYHNAIRAIIPSFVNHTTNGGDFTGLVTIPMWTERAIFDYLEEDYQYPQSHDINNTEWLMQQYRIINLLKWHNYKIDYNKTYIKYANIWGTQLDLINLYNNTIWNEYNLFSLSPFSFYIAIGRIGENNFYVTSDNGLVGFNGALSSYKHYILSYEFSLSIDLYYKSTITRETNKFYNGAYKDVVLLQDKLTKADYFNFQYIGQSLFFLEIDTPKIEKCPNLDINDYYQCNALGIIIRKFDIENGFKFRGEDW